MKKIKVETVCMLGVLISIIVFIVTCHFQIKDGYARDAGIYVPNVIANSLWGLLLLCIIFSVLFFNLPRFSKRNIAKVLAIVSLVLIITASLAVYISWQFSFEQLKSCSGFYPLQLFISILLYLPYLLLFSLYVRYLSFCFQPYHI